MIKHYALFAGLALLAGCASTQIAEVDATEPVVETGPAYAAGSQEALEAAAGHRVYFAYDAFNLSAAAQATLRQQAEWLIANPEVSVQLAGNADERGTREYNLALGARRAEATKRYLVSLGVNPSRLKAVSHGKERPFALGSTEQSWAQNRNSTTTVLAPGA